MFGQSVRSTDCSRLVIEVSQAGDRIEEMMLLLVGLDSSRPGANTNNTTTAAAIPWDPVHWCINLHIENITNLFYNNTTYIVHEQNNKENYNYNYTYVYCKID